jgi:signal transduction histidine kinase
LGGDVQGLTELRHAPVRRLMAFCLGNTALLLAILAAIYLMRPAVDNAIAFAVTERQVIASQLFGIARILDAAEHYADARDGHRRRVAGTKLDLLKRERAALAASQRCQSAGSGALSAPPAVIALYTEDWRSSVCHQSVRFFRALDQLIEGSLTRRIAISRMWVAASGMRNGLERIDALYGEEHTALLKQRMRIRLVTEALAATALVGGALIMLLRGAALLERAFDEVERANAALAVEAEAARKARDDAQRADRLKGEFLARLSHEIRTPLNGLIGLASLVEAGDGDPKNRRMLEEMRRSGVDLLRIVEDTITISRLMSGDIAPECTPLDLHETVTRASAEARAAASAKGLAFEVLQDGAMPPLWMGDGRLIARMVAALCDNAVRFTPEGGVVVRLEPWGEQGARIVVDDSGPGVPEAMRA